VASVLIAISRYYDPLQVIHLLVPVLAICLALAVFGLYLIFYSWRRARTLEDISRGLKRQNAQLSKLCDLVERGRGPL
jgi:membrane protein YdbS with pleckstrin-like domain